MSPVDNDFFRQLRGYCMTTALITYRLPDFRNIMQQYVWQALDMPPHFPELLCFLEFWRRELEGPIVTIEVTSTGTIGPAQIRQVNAELILPRRKLH